MPLALVPGCPAKRDAVIEGAIVPDLGRLADHYPHAVIDEEPPSDRGARVYFNAGQPAPDMRDEAPEPLQIRRPQKMAEAMEHHGVESRVARDHFPGVPRSGIALEHDCNLLLQAAEHGLFQGCRVMNL
jgi:hypothetical protein